MILVVRVECKDHMVLIVGQSASLLNFKGSHRRECQTVVLHKESFLKTMQIRVGG